MNLYKIFKTIKKATTSPQKKRYYVVDQTYYLSIYKAKAHLELIKKGDLKCETKNPKIEVVYV